MYPCAIININIHSNKTILKMYFLPQTPLSFLFTKQQLLYIVQFSSPAAAATSMTAICLIPRVSCRWRSAACAVCGSHVQVAVSVKYVKKQGCI